MKNAAGITSRAKPSKRTVLLSLLLSIGIGVGSGIFIIIANLFISSAFTSDHYTTPQQLHHYTFGIVLAYTLLFAVVSLVQIFAKISDTLTIFYPLSGGISLFVACYIRGFEAGLATIDCGAHCVDTIAPQATEDAATRLVIIFLTVLYVIGLVVYIGKYRAAKHKANPLPIQS